MNLKKILLLSLSIALLAGFTSCGRIATSADPADNAHGEINTGTDQDQGQVNTGSERNEGVVNTSDPANANGIDVDGSPMRKPDGSCYNNTDANLATSGQNVLADEKCNEEDEDIDGDGIANTDDDDMDGDGIPNTADNDMDGDGIDNIDDNDIDGDGVANVNDGDIDGDGIPNSMDNDTDGDGILDIDDNDIDGDGIANTDDDDIDGDGIVNGDDSDLDGDGIPNIDDNDIDGDGIENSTDSDLDGDGIENSNDNDIDGDNVPNASDTDANGDGEPDNGNNQSGKVVYFSKSGRVHFEVIAGQKKGSGFDQFSFQELRDSAIANDANPSTVIPNSLFISADPTVAETVRALGTMPYTARLYYKLPGQERVLLAMTPANADNQIAELADGISFENKKLLPSKYFETFQDMCGKPIYDTVELSVEIELTAPSPVNLLLPIRYQVFANAKADL